MDNLFKNADYEKIYKTLIQIYVEQERIKVETTIIKKEETNG